MRGDGRQFERRAARDRAGKLSVATLPETVIFGGVEPMPEPPLSSAPTQVEFAGIGIFSAKSLMCLTLYPLTSAFWISLRYLFPTSGGFASPPKPGRRERLMG